MAHPLQGRSIVIHGPPKVGKTVLSARFPGPVIFFATEKGHDFLPKKIRESLIRCTTDDGWETFRRATIPECKTIVVDTIDQSYSQCLDHVCKRKGFSHPDEAGHGRGWAEVRREFVAGHTQLAEYAEEQGATLIYISHTKTDELQLATRKLSRLVTTMSGQCAGIINANVDHIWFLGYARHEQDAMAAPKEERALWLLGSESVQAGTRDPQISRLKQHGIISPLHEQGSYQQILTHLKNHRSKK